MENFLEKLQFNKDGLIPAIAQDEETKEVLMMAWMNKDSLKETLLSKRATYFSRSRNSLWKKGETSGNFQEVKSIKADCDFDSILLTVKQTGSACHTGERSCFFRSLEE